MVAVASQPPTAMQTHPTTPGRAHPVGVIEIGHSGENSDPSQPRRPALENSWATGTSPAVDSVHTRLVAARPSGHAEHRGRSWHATA